MPTVQSKPQLARSPGRMLPTQLQHLLLDLRLRLIGMTPRSPAPIFKPRLPLTSATLQPFVATLARYLVNPAQFRHRPLTALILLNKLPPLLHYTTRSPAHAFFYMHSVRDKCVNHL